MTVGEMTSRMSSRELSEWKAFYALEPFGEERGDIRQAITSALIANAHRDPKKGKAFEPQDFMPFSEKPEEPAQKSPEQLRNKLASVLGRGNVPIKRTTE